MRKVLVSFLALSVLPALLVAQTPSFAGKWTLNMAKSQFSGITMTLEKTSSGAMHYDSSGFSYDFDVNGKEYPFPDGSTMSWRAMNPTTWEGTNRMNGKVVGTFRWSLNGNTITSMLKAAKADGSPYEATMTFSRLSGGPGFLGKWKSTQLKGAPSTLEITPEGSNGITLTMPEFQAVVKGNFDGKEFAVLEAGAVSKQMAVLERAGKGFKMTTKLNGKSVYVDVFTPSPDGRSLTDDGNTILGNEPIKAVYDRR